MKKTYVTAILFALIIVGVFIAGRAGLNIAEGTSTLSLSQVDLDSSFGPLNGKAWVYTFRTGGLSQIMRARVTPDDVAGEYDGSETPEKEFTMDVYVDKQQCVYDVKTSTRKDIAKLSLAKSGTALFKSQCESKPNACASGSTQEGFIADPDLSFTGYFQCYSVCSTKEAESGVFDTPDLNSFFSITVDNGDQSASQQFATLDGTVESKVGDNVYVQWNGNLGRGISCPDKDEYDVNYVNGRWRITDANAYDDWSNSYDDALSADGATSFDAIKSNIALANARADEALRSVAFRSDVSGTDGSLETVEGVLVSPTQLSGSRLTVDLTSLIEFPVITAYVKVDWIGIHTPVGKPKIVGADSACFATGEDGRINVKVQNVGDEREEFLISASCSDVISADSTQSLLVLPGETKSTYINIGGDTDKKVVESCVVTAKGKVATDTKTVDACVDPQVVCQAGSLSCGNKEIRKCNDAGSAWVTLQTCDVACEVDSGGIPQCAAQQDAQVVCEEGQLVDSKADCPTLDSSFNAVAFWIALLLALIVGLIVFFQVLPLMSGDLDWLWALLVALVAAVVVFLLVGFVVKFVTQLFSGGVIKLFG